MEHLLRMNFHDLQLEILLAVLGLGVLVLEGTTRKPERLLYPLGNFLASYRCRLIQSCIRNSMHKWYPSFRVLE